MEMKGHESITGELVESEREWKNAERMIYVTIPVVKDMKLMIKALTSVHQSMSLAISAVLKTEYLLKKIELSSDANKNLDVFFSRAQKYGLSRADCAVIKEVFDVFGKHKSAASEFVRIGKVVVMGNDLKTTSISYRNMKGYLLIGRKLLDSALSAIKGN